MDTSILNEDPMKGFTDLLNSLGEEIEKIPPQIQTISLVPQQVRNNHQSKAAGVRVYPLVSFAPFKWFLTDSQAGTSARWGDPCDAVPRAIRNQKKMKWAPGTVTAVVRKENDVNCVFMLTVGHAFWDMDLNKSSSQQVDVNEGRVSNTLNFWWGEFNMDLVQDIGPHSESYGQYYRMGDKLGSKVDCGLARVNSGVVWSNYYAERIPGYLVHTDDPHELARGIFINLVALDDKWPPPDGSYRVREVTITSKEFIFCDHFFSQFENWEGKSGSEIERAMIRPRPGGNDAGANGTSLWSGASGSALIRYEPELQGSVVVGMFLGSCKAKIAPAGGDTKTVYDVFQHISVAKEKLGLAKQLPQPA